MKIYATNGFIASRRLLSAMPFVPWYRMQHKEKLVRSRVSFTYDSDVALVVAQYNKD